MRKSAFGIAVLLSTYAAWPYLAVYEIGQDIQQRNVGALTADFDWSKLREGLKEDVADGITGVPGQAVTTASASDDDLPPFGSGFVANMAGKVVDQAVTPQNLANTAATLCAAGAEQMSVSRAYFTGPTSFVLALNFGRKVAEPLRLRLNLVQAGLGMRWKVTHAWVPAEMLAASEAHAS